MNVFIVAGRDANTLGNPSLKKSLEDYIKI
jgi:hypothetical protein